MEGITIRQIRVEDAEAFLALCNQLDRETPFMMLEPGERDYTVEEQAERIRRLLEKGNSRLLVADVGDRLVGYVMGVSGTYRRNRHKLHIILGVLREYHRKGIGGSLMKRLEAWAFGQGITRLELTVMAGNRAALALYRRLGFAREGVIRNSLRVDGRYVDEYLMARLIGKYQDSLKGTVKREKGKVMNRSLSDFES
jgi:RimJ/RimL family protein N-acetyltransferase